MNTPQTLFRWEQDGTGGDHGTLTLWPGTHREFRMPVANFKTANELGMGINGATKEAFKMGRQSMLTEISEMKA